jgi:YD repeat-containing protein
MGSADGSKTSLAKATWRGRRWPAHLAGALGALLLVGVASRTTAGQIEPSPGVRVFLPVARQNAPQPLKPVPTVYPQPSPGDDGLAGCSIEEHQESRIDGVLYRVEETTEYAASGQPLRRESYYSYGGGRYFELFRYDSAGKRVAVVYREGGWDTEPTGVTHYEYDPDGRLTRIASRDPDGELTRESLYEYDGFGNLVVESGSRRADGTGGLIYLMAYDEQGRRVRQEFVSHWTGEVDSVLTFRWIGNLLAETEHAYVRDGTAVPSQRTRFEYDPAGRLHREATTYASSGESSPRVYRYSHRGELVAIETLTSTGELLREQLFEYDSAGRWVEQRTVEAATGSVDLIVRRMIDCSR